MLGATKPVIIRRLAESSITLGVAPAAVGHRSAGKAASLSC